MTDKEKLKKRHRAIRARLSGNAERPRLQVLRSAKHIYAQLIDDEKGETLLSSSDHGLKKEKKTKTDIASQVGKDIAKKAKEKGVKSVVFDRRGYLYHGRVKALAEGAREGGLQF